MTVVENVMTPDAIARFKAKLADVRARQFVDESRYDGQFWIMDALVWSAEVASAVTHEVALWLCRQYMSTEEIHFCHQPVITTLKPARELRGTFPEGGWHSDYPYHPGVFANDVWPASPVYGVQFNICIDEFRADNAATQFVPHSHLQNAGPPDEFNVGGTRAGEGVFAKVEQLCAPAGAAIIYDSRTWHRACHELNQSGADRVAILNAVTPAWVRPMIDKTPVGEAFRNSTVPAALTEREAAEIERLCNSATLPTPHDAPVLAERRRSNST